MARKNLKVPEELFYALRDDKDDEQSWPHYLEEQCLHDESKTNVSHDKLADEIAQRVDTLTGTDTEVLAREVSRQLDYAAIASKVGEEVEGRMR